jgi:ADP-heptose:LPS heptosyltransferase
MRITLVRQAPSIGDCLLLGPLVREIKAQHPGSHLTVITDPTYMSGALVKVFEGIDGVDNIEQIDGFEWNPTLPIEAPYSVRTADKVYDCNTAFLDFERAHAGQPPYGISEFWVRHFGLYKDGMDLRPKYTSNRETLGAVERWLHEKKIADKKRIGIVLRAGHPARNWDPGGWAGTLAEWAHCKGYAAISFDPIQGAPSVYNTACVGQQIDFVAGLLRYCRVVLTPDTGLLHLAEAVGTRTVALWGIMDPALRVKDYDTVLVPPQSLGFCTGQRERECTCMKQQRWSCLKRIQFGQVIAGLEEALR